MDRRMLQGGAGRLGSAWWRRGPLITPDANRVAHVIWRNGALVDLAGNTWTQGGTVDQIPSSGSIPPGTRYTGANKYTLGAGADVLDFAGDWTGVFVLFPSTVSGLSQELLNHSVVGISGYRVDLPGSGTPRINMWSSGGGAVTANTIATGTPQVVSAGRSGTNCYIRLNLGASVAGAITPYVSPVAVAPVIGSDGVSGQPCDRTTILEMYLTTSTPTDALTGALVSQVFQRLKRSP
jgi:hypothetical protein